MNKNVNCLEGMRCPNCKHEDEVVVLARMWVSVSDNGTDAYADSCRMSAGVDYGDLSAARCPDCGYEGRVGEWYADRSRVAVDGFMEAGLALEIVHSAALQLRDRHGEIAAPANTPHEFDTALDVVEDLIVNNFGDD